MVLAYFSGKIEIPFQSILLWIWDRCGAKMGRRRPFIILLGAPVLLSGILQFIGLLRQFFSKRLFLFCSVFTINWWEASIQSTRTSLVCCDRDKVNNMNSWSRNSILLKMIWTRKSKGWWDTKDIKFNLIWSGLITFYHALFN